MRKYLLAAAAALMLGGSAYADQTTDEVAACMRNQLSSACQGYRQMRDQENRLRALEQRERQRNNGWGWNSDPD